MYTNQYAQALYHLTARGYIVDIGLTYNYDNIIVIFFDLYTTCGRITRDKEKNNEFK